MTTYRRLTVDEAFAFVNRHREALREIPSNGRLIKEGEHFYLVFRMTTGEILVIDTGTAAPAQMLLPDPAPWSVAALKAFFAALPGETIRVGETVLQLPGRAAAVALQPIGGVTGLVVLVFLGLIGYAFLVRR